MMIGYEMETVRRRLKYVIRVVDGDISIAEAARDAGVAWKTMSFWVQRFRRYGAAGLQNRSRGSVDPVDDETRERIISLKRENRSRSCRKIRDLLEAHHGTRVHRQTIWRVLRDAGENEREKQSFKVYRDFERTRPNSLWQVDFMDAIILEGLGLVYLLVFVDDYSRRIVGARFVDRRTEQYILELLWDSILIHGLPSQIYSDQGSQFKSHQGKGFTRFETACKSLGIGTVFASRYYPEGKGKIERLFGFVQSDFLPEHRFLDLCDMNEKFNDWVKWYNEKHEHSSLGGKPPNSRYRNFKPRMPEGDLFEIFSEHDSRMVRRNGTISFRGRIYPVDPTYVSKKVEIFAFGDYLRICDHSQLIEEYDTRIDYKETMMRRSHTRIVFDDGKIRFQKKLYHIGEEYAGRKVKIVIIRDQLRVFLNSRNVFTFKMGEEGENIPRRDR